MSSYVKTEGDGVTQVFTIPFPYISQEHVYVHINGVRQDLYLNYSWLTPSSIRFNEPPAAGALIEIKRLTAPSDKLVEFQPGAHLPAEDLNIATLQNFYRSQEIQDQLDGFITTALIRYGNGAAVTADELIAAVAQNILDSELLSQLQARIEDIDLNAQSILEQTLRLDGLDARILIAEETVVTETTAFAQTLALLGAKNDDNTAFVLDQNSVFVDTETSLGTRLAGIDAAVGDAHAAILSEQTARAAADSALAADITTLQSTVGDNTASIQTHASTLDGLTAQYMVKTDVNGYVAGFGLYNDGATSDFIVLANRFAVVTPGQTPKVPFAVQGNTVYMQNVVIQDALIDNLTITKLTSGVLNADMQVGTGRIIWNNGTYMKVTGVGFGTSNQFIEWFGPTRSINQCNEAAAISYLKTNGDAYFGGALHAGVLSNSVTSSDLNSNAQAVLGPYGTNGNPKLIAVSYTASSGGNSASPPSGTPSATLRLWRRIGSSAEVTVRTDTFTGNLSVEFDTGLGMYTWSWQITGSYTLTENVSPTTGDRTYRCQIISRSTPSDPNNPLTQRITLTSTEN